MQTSDFLTILGLALAVWAIIPSKERRFILLFFSRFEIGVLIALLIIIHYLMSFDWILQNWFPDLAIFTIEKGIPSSTWAYIIAVITVFYPILKVAFGYFSSSRLRKTIELYRAYLKGNEIDLLATCIEKYHISDINKYLQGISNLPKKDNIDIILRNMTDEDEVYEKLVKPKRIRFAASVYGHILQNESFIRKAANKYPELFATAISGMESKEASNDDLVKPYVKYLFEEKNQMFVQELKIMNGTNSSVLERSRNIDIPILTSLFTHTKAAFGNNVWYPVGEEAIKSLKHDEEQREFLRKSFDHDLEAELWNHKIFIAIVYFNYMVRETIYRDSGWHMWLFYFRNFTDLLIELVSSGHDYKDTEYPSFAHKLIYEQISVMTEWLNLARRQNTDNRVIDTVRCLGWCVNSISQANTSKISQRFKRRQLERVLSSYFELSRYPGNIAATTGREWLEKMFLNPKGVDSGPAVITPEYLVVLRHAWKNFDKIPYQNIEDNGSISHFKATVLTPLELEK